MTQINSNHKANEHHKPVHEAPSKKKEVAKETPQQRQQKAAHEQAKKREAHEVTSAINSVINATSVSKNPSRARHNPSEEQVAAGLMFRAFKKANPKLAPVILHVVTKRVKSTRADNKGFPVFRAMNAELRNLVRTKQLSRKEYMKILSYGLGKSQLNGDRKDLTTGRTDKIHLANGKDVAINGTTLAEKVRRNHVATKEEQDAILKTIYGKKEKKTDTPVTNEPPVSAPPAPVEPIETDKPVPLPTSKDIATRPVDFVYKPVSEKDGHAVVQIPLAYADKVDAVYIVDNNDDEVDALNFTGKGNDGRTYFRSNHSGNEYEGQLKVKLHLTNGDYVDIPLDDPHSFFSRTVQ